MDGLLQSAADKGSVGSVTEVAHDMGVGSMLGRRSFEEAAAQMSMLLLSASSAHWAPRCRRLPKMVRVHPDLVTYLFMVSMVGRHAREDTAGSEFWSNEI